ncbi:uncharacterized protein LOC129919593 [Episyrphus balteatus]|uniref:uncharacterized protein LOC129919593 n=1 Tax=Episyrphus balteatus TaxID=286459 RepID=UPI0024854D99|nr:uncharacterized protein LOC129919593 [Episyrphus balteatus]
MQLLTIATLLFASFVASSMALPARLAYYQQQPSFYYQSRASPQRLMYMQYVQQPSVSRTSGRLTNAATAFVAGDTVATGTYVKDDEQQVAASETVLDNTGANGAQSVAEAYPDEYSQDDGNVPQAGEYEVPQVAEDEIPELPQLPIADSQTLEDEPEAVPEANPEPAAPAVPEPAAAAAVELEDEVENDDAASEDDEEEEYVPNDSRRRAVAKATTAAPSPAGSFFSVDFGGASGGAIAISNSYSTGSNGSAKSQAVAFGNPEESRLKNAPSRRRH